MIFSALILLAIAYAIFVIHKEKKMHAVRFSDMQKMYEDLRGKAESRQAVLVDALKAMSNKVDECYDTFNEIVRRFEGMSSSAEDQNAVLRDLAERFVVHSAGLKASFSIMAGSLAALNDATGKKMPSWFKAGSVSQKTVSSSQDSGREQIEFEYGDGEIVSRTYRDGRLFCEVKHDEFGGVKEGTIFDAAGSPKRRFVYCGSENEKED